MTLVLSSPLQLDAPVVTKAFLKHDMETLHDHCGPEIMQRLEGLCKAFQQQVGRDWVGEQGAGGGDLQHKVGGQVPLYHSFLPGAVGDQAASP